MVTNTLSESKGIFDNVNAVADPLPLKVSTALSVISKVTLLFART